jgi:hypothetical protein
MSRFRNILNLAWSPQSCAARQPPAEHNLVAPDRRRSTPGLPDLVPPLVSDIAALFWCQPQVRANGGQQRTDCDASRAEANHDAD